MVGERVSFLVGCPGGSLIVVIISDQFLCPRQVGSSLLGNVSTSIYLKNPGMKLLHGFVS